MCIVCLEDVEMDLASARAQLDEDKNPFSLLHDGEDNVADEEESDTQEANEEGIPIEPTSTIQRKIQTGIPETSTGGQSPQADGSNDDDTGSESAESDRRDPRACLRCGELRLTGEEEDNNLKICFECMQEDEENERDYTLLHMQEDSETESF